jgi:hypothetical protein
MLKGRPMSAQRLSVALERTSTRQCVLPRSGFVHGRRAAAVRRPRQMAALRIRCAAALWLVGVGRGLRVIIRWPHGFISPYARRE